MTSHPRDRLKLPQVTLCAVTSVNVGATMRALDACMAQIDFAACKLLTDRNVTQGYAGITVVPIERLDSIAAYSNFLLSRLVDHIGTSHCLVVQWDGHVIDAGRWLPEFLNYDYIGASWPQFHDGNDVGNGGFSLRSRRLMEACRDPRFNAQAAEDVAIGRVNRDWLESEGMRFAPKALADMFSAERAGDLGTSFGYHGIWHMPRVIGVASFWQVYQELDDRATVRRDFSGIFKDMGDGAGGWRRKIKMIVDYGRHHLRKAASNLYI